MLSQSVFIVLLNLVSNSVYAAERAEAVGTIREGKLLHGFNAHSFLSKNKNVQLVSPEEFQFSTKEIADLINDLAGWVHEKWNRPILVGDMSLKSGGKMASHKAHQNGLDVDVGYLSILEKHSGHRSQKFHNKFPEIFDDSGKLSSNFDKANNFQIFKFLVEHSDIKMILVSCGVKKAFVSDESLSKAERAKIRSKLLVKPGHEDHFHIRISCPKGNTKCDDSIPDFMWQDVNCKI